MLTQNYPVRPQQRSLCVLMAARTEPTAFSSLQMNPGLGVVQVGHVGHHPAPPGSTKLAWKCRSLFFPGVQCFQHPRGFHHHKGVQSIIPKGSHYPGRVCSISGVFQHPGGVSIIPREFSPSSQWGFHHPNSVSIIPKGAQSIVPRGFHHPRGFHAPMVVPSVPAGPGSHRRVQCHRAAPGTLLSIPRTARISNICWKFSLVSSPWRGEAVGDFWR